MPSLTMMVMCAAYFTVSSNLGREGVEGVATPCFVRTQGRQDSSQARPA